MKPPAALADIGSVGTLIDVGCGIRPQNIIAAERTVLVDPYEPYLERLIADGTRDETIVGDWRVLRDTDDDAFDVLTALDVIEHMTRRQGFLFLREALRVARVVVIFTPLGEMPQSFEGRDQWDMDGGEWQRHRSAWTPDDFKVAAADGREWQVEVCERFHWTDARGNTLPEPIDAFWAVAA